MQINGSVNKNGCSENKARWQRAAEGWHPEGLNQAADPLKQNGDKETIRPELVLSVSVYWPTQCCPLRRHPLISS